MKILEYFNNNELQDFTPFKLKHKLKQNIMTPSRALPGLLRVKNHEQFKQYTR